MKIRIAVAVDRYEEWNAFGCSSQDPQSDADDAFRMLSARQGVGAYHVVFVEADVPLPPEPVTVSGEVVR